MLTPTPALRILVGTRPTDMRKNFDGLAAIVESLGENPLGGSLFLFRNRRGDRLKLLYWDGDGYALWYKRLEAGTFQLPPVTDESAVIGSAALATLLDGVDLTSIRRRPRYRRPAIAAASS